MRVSSAKPSYKTLQQPKKQKKPSLHQNKPTPNRDTQPQPDQI